ncbi:hypothetical protein E1B28_000378 [Marasmius oreades]|uniref:F-box domain-containing protein n=1 Tax=Marasmius oreades TaxID=181124 RepID=A0A9P8AE21_9AGAR|nr:uncharacterized protein E1B28_000378 [Marasmius oreades]KAG7098426.1 hypothetical protein E1B28_000378 [Marasmius oreades]
MLNSCPAYGTPISLKQQPFNPALTTVLDFYSTTNEPPSSVDSRVVREEITRLQAGIATVDEGIAKIKRLQTRLEELIQEKRRMENQLQSFRPLTHPIRRLPNEALTRIFRFCVEVEGPKDVWAYTNPNDLSEVDMVDLKSRHASQYPGSLNTRNSPWKVGQVCKRWRSLVSSLPQLWTYIDLNWDSIAEIHPNVASFLALQLQRSEGKLLSVSLFSYSNDGTPRSFNDTLMKMVCASSNRWLEASIRVDAIGLLLLSPFRGTFSKLESLHLHLLSSGNGWPGLDDQSQKSLFNVFDITPALNQLVLSGDFVPLLNIPVQFPWLQITTYISRDYGAWYRDYDDHFNLLPKMTNLEKCFLDLAVPDDPDPSLPETPHLIFPNLRTLVLRNAHVEGRSAFEPVLKWLTLPALKKLRLTKNFDTPKSLLAFMTRSSCSLLELSILDHHISDPVVTRILKADCFRGLERLELGGVTDAILQCLRIRGGAGLLVSLRCLVLCGTKRWSSRVLLHVVRSRNHVVGPHMQPLRDLVLQNVVSEGENAIEDPEIMKGLQAVCQVKVRWISEVKSRYWF